MYLRTEDGTAGGLPVWNTLKDVLKGGGLLSTTRIPSDMIFLKAGTMLQESATTSDVYQVVKRAEAARAKTTAATVMPYKKNDIFIVGEFIAKADGGSTGHTQSTITRIAQSTNTTWIATAAALGPFAASGVIEEVAAAAITTGALLYTPQFILADFVKVRFDDLTTIDNPLIGIALDASVVEDALPYPVTSDDKTSLENRFDFV